MHDHDLAPLVDTDIDDVLALNQFWVPHVSGVTRDELETIVEQCSLALVARDDDGALGGFVLVLPPGADYRSPNYRFFSDRLAGGDSRGVFRYVDRIAVASTAHRAGVGRRLYEAVFDHALAEGAAEVTCEVNVEPPNRESQAFHTRMGFVEVGRQWNYGDTTQVQLLVRPVGPD